MGVFHVDCEIVNVRQPKRKATIPWLHVETGAELSWTSESALKKAGITVTKKDLPFLMANGQTITRSVGYAVIRAESFETVDEVVFGQPGDLCLLGANPGGIWGRGRLSEKETGRGRALSTGVKGPDGTA